MERTWAIVERELRRFRRSPTLMVVSLVFPVVQLVVLGYAFGGNVKHLRLAIVDQDHGVPAVRVREMAAAVASGAKTVDTVEYADQGRALQDLRDGRVNGVLTIPPEFSRRVLAKDAPRLALIEDNTDNFVSATLAATMNSLVAAYGRPAAAPRVATAPTLDVVEVYPYVPYIQYLLPGSIVMSIFMMVMIGGGIIYIDDKARGLHEGYLVTPISKLELIAGFNLSGTLKAVLSGTVLLIVGSLVAGIPDPLEPTRLLQALRGRRGDGVRPDQHDVPHDGAGHRPAPAACDVRRAEHASLLPERRRLPAAGLPRVDAAHRGGGPVHLRRPRVQVPPPEGHRLRRDRFRPRVPPRLLRGDDGRGDAALPEDAVSAEAGTRDRILEAATALFSEQGYRRVTVRAICRAAGVNVAAVNYHFGDKLGLYREVVQEAIEAMRGTTEESRRAGEGRPAEEKLHVFVRTFVRRLLEAGHPRIQRLVQREMTEPTGLLDRVIAQAVRPRLEYLSGIVAEILDCPPDDPRVLRCIFSVQSQAFATVPNAIGRRLGFSPTAEDADALADHITRFSLAGIRALAGHREIAGAGRR